MKFHLPFTIIITVFFGVLLLGSIVFDNQQIVFADSGALINVTTQISVCGNGIKEIGEQCDGNDFSGRQCSYLGFDGGTLTCSPACEYNTSSCATTAEETATPIFSSGIGGSYTITDGNNSAKIVLPPNFYMQDMRLQMFAFNNGTAQVTTPAPSGKAFIGKVYDFVPIDSNGNIISMLSKPATITLTYTSADTNGFDSGIFAPYYRVSDSTIWHLLSGYTVNTMNRTIAFNVTSLNSFAIFGSSSTPTPPPSGGGGEGSGTIMAQPSTSIVTFSGSAYPGSEVTILRDAVVAATTHVGEDAKFSIAIGGLSGGTYLFSVYAKDSDGNRSSMATVPISVTSGVNLNESGIFLAPTIEVNKSEVKRGDPIRVFGQTTPNGTVTISVHSNKELFFQTPSDKNGVYSYSFLTTPLKVGQHTTNVRGSANGEISRTSSSVLFAVGTQNIKKTSTTPHGLFLGDINHDSKVNLIDFSIESFWYHKPNPPALYDLNGDGIVNIVDFSIMASNWTG